METALTLAIVSVATALLTLAAWVWGRTLPARSVVSRAIEIEAPPESVLLAAGDVPLVCRCIDASAQVTSLSEFKWQVKFLWVVLDIQLEFTSADVVVWRTSDKRRLVQADWQFAVAAAPSGSRVSLTETRLTPGSFTRVWQRVCRLDPRHYLDKGLRGVAAAVRQQSPLRSADAPSGSSLDPLPGAATLLGSREDYPPGR
jgi:hypothetical protein